jgi:hypothetical protein
MLMFFLQLVFPIFLLSLLLLASMLCWDVQALAGVPSVFGISAGVGVSDVIDVPAVVSFQALPYVTAVANVPAADKDADTLLWKKLAGNWQTTTDLWFKKQSNYSSLDGICNFSNFSLS